MIGSFGGNKLSGSRDAADNTIQNNTVVFRKMNALKHCFLALTTLSSLDKHVIDANVSDVVDQLSSSALRLEDEQTLPDWKLHTHAQPVQLQLVEIG